MKFFIALVLSLIVSLPIAAQLKDGSFVGISLGAASYMLAYLFVQAVTRK